MFSILHIYGFQKIVKFVLFYCLDPRFYQKIEIFEIQNFIKIPSFTISFLYFSIFGILFSIPPIQTCPKIMEFFVVFYCKVRDFTNDFWKILKVLLKKNIDMWNIFFFKILLFTICFLFFYYFWHLFSISSICTCQHILQIFIFLFYGLEILS